jgi:hypothetical protein
MGRLESFSDGVIAVIITIVATVVTKLQVPVMYAIFVLDFRLLKWESTASDLSTPQNSAGLQNLPSLWETA